MKGFSSVCFYCLVGPIDATGTVTLKAQQSADDSSFADLEGSAIAYTASDDNKVAILEITTPGDRYVRPVIVRATANGVIDGVIGVQHAGYTEPVTHSSSVVGAEHHLSVSEGTA